MVTSARRLQALILFLLFMSGGRSLSGIDAAFFHLDGTGVHTEAHFESSDGCASHTGHCGLGIPAGTTAALTTGPATPVLHFDQPASSLALLDGRPVTDLHHAGFNPRAPPI